MVVNAHVCRAGLEALTLLRCGGSPTHRSREFENATRAKMTDQRATAIRQNGVPSVVLGVPRRVNTSDRTPLFEQVRSILRDRIVQNYYLPGARLVERDLAVELDVSRIPVREALRSLESEGFVSVLPRRGVVVRELTRIDVEDLFDLRLALEVHACRRAAEHIDEAGARALEQTVQDGRRALQDGDVVGLADASERFHDKVVQMAGNAILVTLIEPILGRLHWVLRQVEDRERQIDDHQALCDAIVAGDAERAAQISVDHVKYSRSATIRILFGEE